MTIFPFDFPFLPDNVLYYLKLVEFEVLKPLGFHDTFYGVVCVGKFFVGINQVDKDVAQLASRYRVVGVAVY